MLTRFFTKIVFIILGVSIISCNSVKRVSDNKYLLRKNVIEVNNEKSVNPKLYTYLTQRPNQKVLGLPIGLYIYNWSNPNFEKNFEQWVKNHPKKSSFISTIFSNKQVKAYHKFSKSLNEWTANNGEPPVIVDSLKTIRSQNTLKSHFQNKGFFDAQVSYKDTVIRHKQKRIEYAIKTNKPYFLDSIKTDIKSKVLDSLYQLTKNKSFIRKGQQFDEDNFIKEQNRLTELFRNSGVYSFNKDYIQFKLDSTQTKHILKDITLVIPDQIFETADSVYSKPFKIQKVKKINIYTDFTFNEKDIPYLDTISYNDYIFLTHNKLKYNPKYLSNAIAVTPFGVYKDSERNATRQYLNELKLFRPPVSIEYAEDEKGDLIASIYLNPLKKYGFSIDAEVTHSNIKPFGILGKFSFLDRNIFKGLEIFDVSIQGSFVNLAEDFGDADFNFFGLTSWEIGGTASLKMPRIFFPINTNKIIPKYMRPKTDISISTSLQKNIGLDRQNITAVMSYSWNNNKKVRSRFDLLNVQYINNLNPGSYFDIFNSEFQKLKQASNEIIDPNNMDSNGNITNPFGYIDYVLNSSNNFYFTNREAYLIVRKVKERQDIIGEDVLVPTISYTHIYTNKEGLNDHDFSFIMGRIVSSGTITSALVKEKVNEKKVLFGLPISQYIKTEFEYKKYWDFGRSNHLVFRSFAGVAIPFGNSTDIPFSRKYRAGGSNDIRAWKSFDLGPGSSKSNLEFNTGNLKFVTNLEYRFKFFNNIYSAVYIDAGNIWDLSNSDLTDKSAKFKGFSSFKEIAVGTGVGFRYDFSFLIFRIDLAFKAYEPYLEGNKWFKHFNINHKVINFGINYPF
jgi:hypothetical protein